MISWHSILAFTVVSTGVLVIAALVLDGNLDFRSRVAARLRNSWRSRVGEERCLLFSHEADGNEGLLRGWLRRFDRRYEQAELPFERNRFLAFVGGSSAAAGAVAAWRPCPLWLGPIVTLIGLATAAFYVALRRNARLRRVSAQLPRALDIIAAAVKAGQTVPAAFQMVADDLEPPLALEFRRCHEQQSLGASFESSLRNLGQRTAIMELRILIIALLVQRRSGGNLAALLQTLSSLVQKRLKLEQRVLALTGEGRMQAKVLIVLPTAAFGALYLLAPDYVAVLLDRPWLIAAALAAQALGAVWICRCIRVAV